MGFARFSTTLGVLVSVSAAPSAQNGNHILPTNGGEAVMIFSDPSVGGATPGSISTNDDLDWKAVPNEVLSADCGLMLEIDSIKNVFVGDSDWTTPPRIHDFAIGPDMELSGGGVSKLRSQVPDFFTTGMVSFLISVGPSGLPDPCSVVPLLCTTPGCPPPITGYYVDLILGSGPGTGIIYPSEIVSDSGGMALTRFLPGGMPFSSSGTCGLGDYEFTGAYSTNENQGDFVDNTGDGIPDGANYIGGFQLGGSPTGPMPDDHHTLLETKFGYWQGVIEASGADVSYGPEEGGASLVLDTSTGTSSLGAVVRDLANVGALVLPAAAIQFGGVPPALLPIPGGLQLVAFGTEACLSLNPANPIFNSTFSAWSGTGPVIGIDTDGDTVVDKGEASTLHLPVPSITCAEIYLQAFVVTSFSPFTAISTTTWCVQIRS